MSAQRNSADTDDRDERDTRVAPEVLLLVLLGLAAWMAGLCFVGITFGWPWMVGWVVVSVAGLFLWGHFDDSVSPEEQRHAERDRQLAELDAEIERAGGLDQTDEATGQAPQVIQHVTARKAEVHRAFREADRAARRRAPWRDQPISAPRRVARRTAQTVLVAAMAALAVAWYGSMVLFPSALIWMALDSVLGRWWALLPAALWLPLGLWCAWWWIRRAPRSAVQAAGIGAAAGS